MANELTSIIIGIFLILAWLPTIYFTEKNNKGNNEEYDILLKRLPEMKATDVKLNFPNNINNENIFMDHLIDQNLVAKNNNILVTLTTQNNSKYTTQKSLDKGNFIINPITYNGKILSTENYIYLARQNPIGTETLIKNNLNYKYNYYAIDKDAPIAKVTGLQQYEKELDMDIYDFEYGPANTVADKLKERKQEDNSLQKWVGRGVTFFMLLIGLQLVISPLNTIAKINGFSPVLSPIINLYNSLSIIGTIILTFLMTFLMWSLVNKPIISILLLGLISGLMIYFHKI